MDAGVEMDVIAAAAIKLSGDARHFTFAELQRATENFSDTLVRGRGGFGEVGKL